LNAGVGGTSMPAWKGVLEDDQIWAVAYYVKSLMEIKDNLNAREELVTKLKNQ
jgi:mono/diheme cytochrome c family protein